MEASLPAAPPAKRQKVPPVATGPSQSPEIEQQQQHGEEGGDREREGDDNESDEKRQLSQLLKAMQDLRRELETQNCIPRAGGEHAPPLTSHEIVDTARVRLQQLWEENAYLKQMLASSPDHDDRQQ